MWVLIKVIDLLYFGTLAKLYFQEWCIDIRCYWPTISVCIVLLNLSCGVLLLYVLQFISTIVASVFYCHCNIYIVQMYFSTS